MGPPLARHHTVLEPDLLGHGESAKPRGDWAVACTVCCGPRRSRQLGDDAVEMARGHASLGDSESRAAFVHTLRASLDVGGQRVQALDRLYLAEELALLIVWGARDHDEPERFVATFEDWIATTRPGHGDDARFRAAVRRHAA